MSAPPASLRRRTVRALLWSGLGQYGASGVRLLSLLALGWLLPPTDFGLLAMALVFVVFVEGIGELGMVFSLVQQKENSKQALDTAFWCSSAVYLALIAVTLAFAGPVTSFLGDSRAAPLLRLLSLMLLINAFSVVPRAILVKAMDFRQVSLSQLAGEIGFGVVGLGLAALGFGVWGLAGAVLTQRLLITGVLWRAVEWRPGTAMSLDALRDLIRFGGPVMAGSVIERGLLNADYFVIGRFIGTEALGYYSLAFQLALIPLERLVGFTGRVAFPAFAIVQDEPRRLAEGLLEGFRHLFTVVLPVVMGIVVLGPWLLRGVYAEKWEPSIVPLQILGLSGVFFLPKLVEAALLAVGRPHLRMWFSLLRLAAFAVLVGTVGLRYGIVGVAASVGGALAVWAVANLAAGMRILGLRPGQVAASLWPAARAGLAALAPLAVLLFVPTASFSPFVVLAFAGIVLFGVYLAIVVPGYRRLIAAQRSADPAPGPLDSGPLGER